MIHLHNGPGFISNQLDAWCKDHKIEQTINQHGKPMQNGFIKRSNDSIRMKLLNTYVFRMLNEVRIIQ